MQLQKSWREIDLLWWYVHFLSSLEIDDRIGAYDDLGELLTSDTSLSTYVTIGNITLLNPKFSDWGIFSILFRRKNNKIWYLFQIWKACSFEMKNICEIEIKTNGMNFPLWILIGKFETFSKKKSSAIEYFQRCSLNLPPSSQECIRCEKKIAQWRIWIFFEKNF